jgi:hypothetical protein
VVASRSSEERCSTSSAIRFYIGEVRYKADILPGGQPPTMKRTLFDAVQQKLTDQWTTRTSIRDAGDKNDAGGSRYRV